MTFDKTKPKPAWLSAKPRNEGHARGLRYYNAIWDAQPAWANRKAINRIYTRAKRMRERGIEVHVDHIIPLNHPHICGLHVPANLRIMCSKQNRVKSNYSWPGKGQLSLFEPEDFELEYQL